MGNGLIDLSDGRLPLSIGDYETAYEQGGLIYESYINTGLLSGITENIFGKYTLPKLKKIDMPNVNNIAGALFRYGNSVEIINAPELITIGSSNFLNMHSVSKLTFPKVLQIQDALSTNSPFIGCESLEEINLENCTYIGSYAFNECHNLKEINIINAERIGSYAFKNCYNLEKINLRKIINIDDDVFNGCSKLSEITLGNITSINSDCQIHMYDGPTYSSNVIVTFPDLEYLNGNFIDICNTSFLYDRTLILPNCSEIQNLDEVYGYTEIIANKVKAIQNTSMECRNIISLTLNGLDNIASKEFINFSNLQYITFKNAKHIGNQAFANCKISDFYFPECTAIDGLVMNKGYNINLPKLSVLNIGKYSDESSIVTINNTFGVGTNCISIGASVINMYSTNHSYFDIPTYPENGIHMPNLKYINFVHPSLLPVINISYRNYGSYDGSSTTFFDTPADMEFSNLIDIPIMDSSYSLSIGIITRFIYEEQTYVSSAIRIYDGCRISFPKYIGNSQTMLAFEALGIDGIHGKWSKLFTINFNNILNGRLHIDMPVNFKEFKLCSDFSGSLYINMYSQYVSWLTFPSKMHTLECSHVNIDTLYLKQSTISRFEYEGSYINRIELPNCTYISSLRPINYYNSKWNTYNIISMPNVSYIGYVADDIRCNSELYIPNLDYISYSSTFNFSSPRITLGISNPDLIPRYEFDGTSYLSLSKLQYIPSGNAGTAYIDAVDAEIINLDSVSYISTYGLKIRKVKSLYLPNLQTIAENYGIQCDNADIKYISLPKIESLPASIFMNCSNLSAITLPPTCSVIGRNALPKIIGFLRLEYDGVVSMGAGNFAYKSNCIVQVPGRHLSSYISDPSWASMISNYSVNLIGY